MMEESKIEVNELLNDLKVNNLTSFPKYLKSVFVVNLYNEGFIEKI